MITPLPHKTVAPMGPSPYMFIPEYSGMLVEMPTNLDDLRNPGIFFIEQADGTSIMAASMEGAVMELPRPPGNGFSAEQVSSLSPAASAIEIEISNITSGPLRCVLFDPLDNRNAANFGNPVGIVITTSVPGGTNYGRILAQTEISTFNVGMVRMWVVSGDRNMLRNTWILTTGDGRGQTARPIRPPHEFPGQQLDINEVRHNFMINAWCKIELDISAQTTVRFFFFENQQRFSIPDIARPEQITLSPAALAALRT